jgi:transcriptional regulator with XRE-family HTH domain
MLADARRRSGKTQVELAKVMGTTQSVIARAEAGSRMPTIGFIDRWATATRVRISLKLGASQPRTQIFTGQTGDGAIRIGPSPLQTMGPESSSS